MKVAYLIVTTLIAGCSIGPDYIRPAVDVPSSWRIDYTAAAEVANTRWWEAFGDPALNELIETSLRGNLDVRIAAARVDQFIGSLQSTRAQLFPQFGYGVDASRLRASRSRVQALPPGVDNYFTLYEASLGATWQIDLFGRVRALHSSRQKT